MKFILKISLIAFLLQVVPYYLQATGLSFIRNYPSHEYMASPQNWSVVQDQRGVMYFGNNDGVLTYDGVSWRLIKIPGVGPLAIDSTGTVYVGLDNDIGYLKPDVTGNLQFHSLLPEIPEEHREINICYRIFTLGGQVIYQTADRIYLYNGRIFQVIATKTRFHFSFLVNNRFYVAEAGTGLLVLQGNSLQNFMISEQFDGYDIIAVLPYKKDELLIVSDQQGILIYNREKAGLQKSPLFGKVNDFILQHQPYCAIQAGNGDYLIGTVSSGIVVADPKGNIRQVYNKKTGLLDNSVYQLYIDRNDQLWAALDNGISLVQYNLPFYQYDERSGINGSVMCIRNFNDRLYVGTSQQVFISGSDGTFQAVSGTTSQNFHLFESQGSLLLANIDGIHEIRGDKAFPLKGSQQVSALSFCVSAIDTDKLFVGAVNGIYQLQHNGLKWNLRNRIRGFSRPSYNIESDRNGNLWVSTFLEMFQLKLNANSDSVLSSVLQGTKQGLPSGYAIPFSLNSGEIVFGTEKGVYHYLENERVFVPHPDFTLLTGKVIQLYCDKDGSVWYEQLLRNGNYEKGVLVFNEGISHLEKRAFSKFMNLSSGDCSFNICRVADGPVYFGSGLGLLQYLPGKDPVYERPYNTLIRGVFLRDSLLYGGEHDDPFQNNHQIAALKFGKREIVFHYAAAFFEDAEKNLYSYRLKGLDEDWSEWTPDHKKEYTNLHEGYYTFEVRSKNIYNVTGSTASCSFRIMPPWYRTWWAFSLYPIMLIVCIWGVTKLNARRLDRRNRQLEALVTSRTEEVTEQKLKIQETNEELTQTNQKLFEANSELSQANQKLKSTLRTVSAQKAEIEHVHDQISIQNMELQQYRDHLEQLVEERTEELLKAKNRAEESDRLKTSFLQNMSHEIRTPMNGILGFLKLIEDPDIDIDIRSSYIDIIRESGQRLLKTINDIIEISRIESNQVTIKQTLVDVRAILDYQLKFYHHQAKEKGIQLSILSQLQDGQSVITTDSHLLNGIITNLIGNAFKFTKEGGIELGNYLEDGSLVFYVRDTGIGIPAEKLESIFGRFVQADGNNTREYEGSGLGLSIVKGYLEMLNGKVWVESELGKGSTFYFSIPYQPASEVKIKEKQKEAKAEIHKKGLKVLIAEDDMSSFLYLKNLLKGKVDCVHHANNGVDAVKLFQEMPDISLILLDIKMPEKDGYEVAREIRAFNKKVIIIAQTAFAMADDIKKAIRSGCNDYITKPVDSNALIALINKYCK